MFSIRCAYEAHRKGGFSSFAADAMVQAVSVGADIHLDLKLGDYLQRRMVAEGQSTYQFVRVQPKAVPVISQKPARTT